VRGVVRACAETEVWGAWAGVIRVGMNRQRTVSRPKKVMVEDRRSKVLLSDLKWGTK
jgi:hypothetical protein